ncbi:MAG: AI-2E family transporter [Planctomycetota bacterium]
MEDERGPKERNGFGLIRRWLLRHLGDPQVQVLVLTIALVVLTIGYLGKILAPVFLSMILAYLLDSAVVPLQRRGLPRLPTVLIFYVLFLALFLLVLLVLLPILSRQIGQIPGELPTMLGKVETALRDLVKRYDFAPEPQFEQWLMTLKGNLLAEIGDKTKGLGKQVLDTFRGAVVIVLYTILIPILVFFMVKDKEAILAWFSRFVPEESSLTRRVWREVDQQIGNYIRGKVWEILIVGGTSFLVFRLFGLDYAPLLGLSVGLSVVIPYLGATLVTFPVVLVAYSQWGAGAEFVKVVIAYLVIQALDGNLLVPLLFGEMNKLHPLAIIVAVIIFGGLWGVWGVFFAIPLATFVQAVIQAWPRGVEARLSP